MSKIFACSLMVLYNVCMATKQLSKKQLAYFERRRQGFSYLKTYPLEYNSWRGMKNRCNHPNSTHYKHYGGRGIKICKRWQSFPNFIEDMGKKPSSKHSLDRIDNNGDYGPNNCRWATAQEQTRNASKNIFVEADGKQMYLEDFFNSYKVPLSSFYKALKLYGTHQKAVDVIIKHRGERNYIVGYVAREV